MGKKRNHSFVHRSAGSLYLQRSLVQSAAEFYTSSGIYISRKTALWELHNIDFHGQVAARKPHITKHDVKCWMKMCEACESPLGSTAADAFCCVTHSIP